MSKRDQLKKIAKYSLNTLNIVNVLLLGISQIYNLDFSRESALLILFCSVISTYLLGNKIATGGTESY